MKRRAYPSAEAEMDHLMKTLRSLAALVAAAAFSLASPALAHPRMLSSSPVQSSSTNHVDRIVLTFSEPLVPAMSGFDVVMTEMPGMTHGGRHQPLKVNGVRVVVGPDGKSLIGTLARRLSPGTYEVNWRAVSTDTHRITGKVSFAVR